MADSHPFSNAGLGMFGAGDSFAKQAMMGGGGSGQANPLGLFLAGLLKGSKDKQTEQDAAKTAPAGSVAPTQYEPQTAFPDILQQQYATPYKPAYGQGPAMPPPTTSLEGFMTQPYRAPQAPAPADPMAGFKTQNPFTVQPQTTASGYHPVTDALWGNK